MIETDIFIKCTCNCSALQIQKDEEDKEFYVSLWVNGIEGRVLGLKRRLQWCWNILRTGKPWTDCVCISEDDAVKLAEYITKHVISKAENYADMCAWANRTWQECCPDLKWEDQERGTYDAQTLEKEFKDRLYSDTGRKLLDEEKPLHLCRTCAHLFSTCKSNPTFAIEKNAELRGSAADAVIECTLYEKDLT